MLSLHAVVFVLIPLASEHHARRVQWTHEQVHGGTHEDSVNLAEAEDYTSALYSLAALNHPASTWHYRSLTTMPPLAKLLLTKQPAAAFNPSGPRRHFKDVQVSRGCTVRRHRAPSGTTSLAWSAASLMVHRSSAPRSSAPRMIAPDQVFLPPTVKLELDEDAKAMLEAEHVAGDNTKAIAEAIRFQLAICAEDHPELVEAMRTDPTSGLGLEVAIQITFNAIALFLPVTHSPNPTPEAAKKLMSIVRTGCEEKLEAPSVLDVGCGIGMLLPFLWKCGVPLDRYYGIDVSFYMIESARQKHSIEPYANAIFNNESFAEIVERAAKAKEGGGDGIAYDTIFFNSVLEFFNDPLETLKNASTLLSQGPHSRIVVSHMGGTKFVKAELKDNPYVTRSELPTLTELSTLAKDIGMQVIIPSFLGTPESGELDSGLEDFYLVALRWDAEQGGTYVQE